MKSMTAKRVGGWMNPRQKKMITNEARWMKCVREGRKRRGGCGAMSVGVWRRKQ